MIPLSIFHNLSNFEFIQCNVEINAVTTKHPIDILHKTRYRHNVTSQMNFYHVTA